MILLDALDLTFAAILIIALAALSHWQRLGLGRSLLISSARTLIQLLLVGLVLEAVFAIAKPVWIGLMALVMLAIAAREVRARQQQPFTGLYGLFLGLVPMFLSSFTLTLFALTIIIGTQPWYTPQYAIPLLGMLLGNTMNAISLSLDRLTQSAWQQRNVIEGRLMLGQDRRTAIGDIMRDSTRIGMIPMINAMAAAGVVSLPGMMTGQILSGTPPMEAVKYQILIMFLITASTGFATILAVTMGARRLFDDRDRLRLDRVLAPKAMRVS